LEPIGNFVKGNLPKTQRAVPPKNPKGFFDSPFGALERNGLQAAKLPVRRRIGRTKNKYKNFLGGPALGGAQRFGLGRRRQAVI